MAYREIESGGESYHTEVPMAKRATERNALVANIFKDNRYS